MSYSRLLENPHIFHSSRPRMGRFLGVFINVWETLSWVEKFCLISSCLAYSRHFWARYECASTDVVQCILIILCVLQVIPLLTVMLAF